MKPQDPCTNAARERRRQLSGCPWSGLVLVATRSSYECALGVTRAKVIVGGIVRRGLAEYSSFDIIVLAGAWDSNVSDGWGHRTASSAKCLKIFKMILVMRYMRCKRVVIRRRPNPCTGHFPASARFARMTQPGRTDSCIPLCLAKIFMSCTHFIKNQSMALRRQRTRSGLSSDV